MCKGQVSRVRGHRPWGSWPGPWWLSGENTLCPGPRAHLWDAPSYEQGSANPVSTEVVEGTAQRREGAPQGRAHGPGRLSRLRVGWGVGVSEAPDEFPGRSVQSIRRGREVSS